MSEEKAERAYVYLVKIPGNNDMIVCASDSVYYRGTNVIVPTRYGLDLGVVVGPASEIQGSCNACGNRNILGACHFEHVLSGDDDIPEVTGYEQDGRIMMEGRDGKAEEISSCLENPQFEFVPGEVQPLAKVESCDESGLWDSTLKAPEMTEVDGDVVRISHVATPEELKRFKENTALEAGAIRGCREKIAKHGLDMKLVAAHFLLCEPKALFFFTAESRVDFRELVKDLVSMFRMRIELRQIGVRDEARMLGGLAVCGRDLCCHCVSDKLNPVTIKMAKEQNLSLNSMKISGPCGRLLCCLGYEHEFYCEEKLAYPSENTRLKIGDELYKVQEINILSKKVVVAGSEGRAFQIPRSELEYNGAKDRWEVSYSFQKDFLGN